jgi:predicted nuclease of predicted toxin-antitoxin system
VNLKFKIDENLPTEVAVILRAAGHDALTVMDQQLSGRPDPDIASVCQLERRAVITLDKGFSDIRSYPPQDYAGIIVLRLVRVDKWRILATLQRLIAVLSTHSLEGKLWIVDETRVRIRS